MLASHDSEEHEVLFGPTASRKSSEGEILVAQLRLRIGVCIG